MHWLILLEETSLNSGTGRYAPGTSEGQRLLAHELTHVVQQSSIGGSLIGQKNEKRDFSSVSKPVLRSTTLSPRTCSVNLPAGGLHRVLGAFELGLELGERLSKYLQQHQARPGRVSRN